MMSTYETKPMSIRHEIKSQLAKLLATEDLVVEHKKVSTACFNVHTRVLTLPLWEKASGLVYDLLVGHEVGHALFTPDEDWTDKIKVPPQFVNVVEDARVEKLMKRKYAGLAKTFFNGYKELNEDDFFQLADEDISSFNLADRVNLYFKVGNFITLDFNPEEQEIIELISASETFADVLIAAEELYKYCKQEKEQQQKVADFDSHETQGDSQSPANEIVETNDSSSEQEDDSDNSQPQENQGGGQSAHGDQTEVKSSGEEKEPEVRTADSLEEKLRDLVGNDSYENTYVEVPQLNLNTVIGSNFEVHKDINNSFAHQQKLHNEHAKEKGYTPANLYKESDTEFQKFKTSAQKEVNYLVKEFECRKAADQYARASTARTGVLDTTRLHTYKYNEDLFKKVSVIPDGKNHGLVFVLDWSGSMSDVMLDTCKQLFNLVWFCKKVSIPFEVYAFTNEWRRGEYDYENDRYLSADRTPHYEKKESLLVVDETFSMMNILTSKVSGKELENQLVNIWRLAYCFANSRQYQSPYTYPTRLCLSGTPLNEALISLHQILPKFQRENKLQKVQCIVLTDGEANQLVYHREVKRAWEKDIRLGTGYVNPHTTFLRDRKLGTTYKIDNGYHTFTDTLLRNLKDKFSSTNFIGIRVLESRNAQRFINLYHSASDDNFKEYLKIQDDWKKMRSFTITNSGYDAYFGLSSSALSQDSEFEVSDGSTKAQIKSAFVKSLKTKKLNKKVLGEFISLVA
jgi:hypothetical protein